MIIKFVCVLLMLAVVEAFPSSDVKSTKDEPTCPKKIAWYRDITNKTKIMYSEYHAKLIEVDLTSDAFNKLSVENSKFENAIASILRKNDTHTDNSTSDEANKQTLCDNIDSYRTATLNLTRAATILKSNVLNIVDHLEVAKEAKDSLNKTFTRIVNFLFEIEMPENAFKDLEPLMNDAEAKATEGIQLEKQYVITKTGIEEMNESEPWNDAAADKEFDDLLNNSAQKDIEDASRALDEREERNRIISERVKANENVDNDEDDNDGLPFHLNPGRTLVNAFKHPALPLTIIGVILIVICGMFVWNWVRPDQWIRSRYARMP